MLLEHQQKHLAGDPSIDISFGGDVAGLVRDQVMLPSLPAKLRFPGNLQD